MSQVGVEPAGSGDRLFDLLPALHRIRDASQGRQLEALLNIVDRERQALDADIERLYADWFIETCEPWVVSYIGDLLGVRGVVDQGGVGGRALVANTLRYRRGKGTIVTLERVARDLSGWPAHAVEFFLLLATTQSVNHVRPANLCTIDLRDRRSLDLIGSPFDPTSHLSDVRHIDIDRGRYDIPNVGVFAWRLRSYAVRDAPPAPAGDGCYRFSPLGNDAPLFVRPLTETQTAQIASEANVPGPLRGGALSFDLRDYAERFGSLDPADRPVNSTFYGPDRSLSIVRDGEPVGPLDVVCTDLSAWDRPQGNGVAVDVERGRLAFGIGIDPADVRVSFGYGFSADIGGGPYDRRRSLAEPGHTTWARTVSHTDPDADFQALGPALAAWADPGGADKGDAILTILDGEVYAEQLTVEPASAALIIQAADGVQPLLRPLNGTDIGDLMIAGGAGADGSLTLSGLLIEGAVRVEPDSLGSLRIFDCTLVPGRTLDATGVPAQPDLASIVAEEPNDRLNVMMDHSICGPVRIPADAGGVEVRDGIVDAPAARRVPVLVSGSLQPFPTLSSPTPTMALTIGDEGPRTVTLASVPGTLADARDLLQAAIRSASTTTPFTQATVTSRSDRLIVIPGSAEVATITPALADPTAAELRLDEASGRRAQGMFGGSLAPFPVLFAAQPEVAVTMRSEAPRSAPLGSVPTSVAEARDALEEAIRAADADPAFADALVVDVGDRLAVVPGTEDGSVTFSATAGDPATIVQLRLQPRSPALAGPDVTARGDAFGAAARLERVTVLGATLVRQLTLASDVIFNERAVAERRQVGCARFSFVPEGSRVPRRYHCQPPAGSGIGPRFTSERYGQPAYGQLSVACPPEIAASASDEGEMGAFNLLHQAQRLESLRRGLDEYLPFGLEAGIFLVT